MNRCLLSTFLACLLSFSGSVSAQDERPRPTRPPAGAGRDSWQAAGTKGAVVAGGAEAVEAGMTVLRRGGNAADAAVATLLALTVTDAQSACFGGEVPIMIYDAKTGAVDVIAGQGAAPRLATLEHFQE